MNIIEKAEKDSNDLAKIESEKKQFDALQLWTAKPRYREPETLWQRIQRSYREWRNDICPIHKIKKTEHGFKGQVDCPECRREYYKRHYTVEAMKE